AELGGLQAELLGGTPDPDRLARLAALQDGEEGCDPGLREAVRGLALRAAVELARRGWPPGG
ncbi:MAG TPA: flagellar assembly protein FliX, partial [Crenalkalicoccus sp.]|nr:flagellar assembly protein FliX [Crenalkalicoccus sp.]